LKKKRASWERTANIWKEALCKLEAKVGEMPDLGAKSKSKIKM
jgi:hypothetical protein